LAPEVRFSVPAIFDEGQKLVVGYRRLRDAKGLDFDGMRPLFVVENKRKIACRADQNSSTRDIDVPRERPT